MTDTSELRPAFGAHRLQPDGLRAVYGGRWIVSQDGYVDIVPDRQVVEGPNKGELIDWLNGTDGSGREYGSLHSARLAAGRLLNDYVLKTRERSPVILYQDERGTIVADTNASGGYLYVTGWLFDDLPADSKTRGLDKVIDAMGVQA